MQKSTVYIGADHGGYELQKFVEQYLQQKDVACKVVAGSDYDPDDDYPDAAAAVADAVQASGGLGILFCTNGVGVCVVANKFVGIRAVNALSKEIVQRAREDDDVNVLCLAGQYVTTEQAVVLVDTFLQTSFSQLPRHKRRLDKIEAIERRVL